jgi:hypothetical protein
MTWGAPLPPVTEYTGGGGGGGTGDVLGPASAVNANIVLFNGTTGKRISDGGVALAALATDAELGTVSAAADAAQATADTAESTATTAQGTATAAGSAAATAQGTANAANAAAATAQGTANAAGSAATAAQGTANAAGTAASAAQGTANTAATAAATAQSGADASAKKAQNGADFVDIGSTRHNLNVPSLSSAIVVSVANQTLSGLPTVDGVTLTDGQRILNTGQTAGAENGPWLVHAGAWTRPTDYPAAGSIPRGRVIEVNAGRTYVGTVWLLTTNAVVTIDTDATTWTRVDKAALSAGPGGPLQMRLPRLASSGWYDKFAAEDVDIIVIGDSIASLGGVSDSLSDAPANPWPWRSYKYMNQRSKLARQATSPSRGIWQGPVFGGGSFAPTLTSTTGTASTLSGAGNWSVSLAIGQVGVLTGHFARVAVVWTQQVGGGTLTCKDETTNPLTPVAGGDGISGNTIVTAGASQKFSRVTFYDMTGGFGLHTFTITDSVAESKVEQVIPLYGNNVGTGGVRMWPCTHSGYTTTLAVNDGVGSGRGYCLDLIERLNTLNPGKLLVVDNMGFNDVLANVATDKAALYAAIRAINANIPIVNMIPWTTSDKATSLRTACDVAGIDYIDPSTFIGNGGLNVDGESLTGDGVHPTSKGHALLSDIASAAITGDVLGVLMTTLMRDVRSMFPSAVAIGDAARAVLGSNSLAVAGTSLMGNTVTVDGAAGASGQQRLEVIFGFPVFSLYKSTAGAVDGSSQLWMMPSSTATALGVTTSGPAIVGGPGAAASGTNPTAALVLDATGVWKFNQPLFVPAMTAGGHAANRDTGDLRWPHTLFDHFADVGSGTTVETTLYTDTIAAGQLSVNGQQIEFAYSGKYASAVTKDIRLKFAGTTLFDSGALTITTGSWSVEGVVQRVSATVVRWLVRYNSDSSTAADRSVTKQGETTGLTLANTAVLAVTGQAGASGANNDIVAQRGKVKFAP